MKSKKLSSYQERKARIAEYSERFAGHKGAARVSKSWHFNTTNKDGSYNSAYAFAVTWTPGSVFLAGDLGELTITHYNAAKTLDGTISWIGGSDFDYLMGKSDAKEEFDPVATCDHIVYLANEEAYDSMRGELSDRRQHRVEVAEAVEEGLPPPEPFVSTLKVDGGRPPDGWRLWHKLWEELAVYGDEDSIFTIVGRRYLKQELRQILHSEGAEGAAALCRELGVSDYYGSSNYTEHHVMQFAALKHWVAHVRAEASEEKEKEAT
jgi:hypothetical protein